MQFIESGSSPEVRVLHVSSRVGVQMCVTWVWIQQDLD